MADNGRDWRDGRVVECGGLENRYPASAGSGVRIPLSPQHFNKPRERGVIYLTETPLKACFYKVLRENK